MTDGEEDSAHILANITTTRQFREALETMPDKVEEAICQDMRRRYAQASNFYNAEEFGQHGWYGKNDIRDDIRIYLLDAAKRAARQVREDPDNYIDRILAFAGVSRQLENYVDNVMNLLAAGSTLPSNYGGFPPPYHVDGFFVRMKEPTEWPALKVGDLKAQWYFSIPYTHLTFDLRDAEQRDEYVRIVKDACYWMSDWTLTFNAGRFPAADGFRWQSSWEDVIGGTSDIFVDMPSDEYVLEMLLDWRFEGIAEIAEEDPATAIDFFLGELDRHAPDVGRALLKQKLPRDVLLSHAMAYLEMDNRDAPIEERLQFVREAVGQFGYEDSRAEVIMEIDRSVLRDCLGIASGKWYERAPWRLVKLPPEELAYEGTMLRHCVGRFDMGYRERVEEMEIEIWSLRDRKGRPRLTWEVQLTGAEMPFDDVDEDRMEMFMTQERGAAITQLKGFANRLAGEGSDEQAVLTFIFSQLMIDPNSVRDYRPRARNPSKNESPWL
jgi:hypothetical protein